MFLFCAGIIIVSLVILVFMLKASDIDFSFFKANYSAYLAFIIILIIVFSIVLKQLEWSSLAFENFINVYILFMLSCGITTILAAPAIGLMQKNIERKIIKNYEEQEKVENFHYYRDLIGDIPPAILFKLYNKNHNIDDLIVSEYLYLIRKKIISLENGVISKSNKIIDYKYEELLTDYFSGKIIKQKMHNNLNSLLKDDLENHGFVYKAKEQINLSESIEFIIAWLIITLIIMMPALVNLSSIGLYLVLTYIIVFISVPIYQKIIKAINPLLRTNESLLIIAKLNGLKNFYNDFNVINHKSIHEIELYNDYIIYGIIFNKKGKLNNEVNVLYTKICNYVNNSISDEIKEKLKLKFIECDVSEWFGFILGSVITGLLALALFITNVLGSISFIFLLLPLFNILLLIIASRQNKRKKLKERGLL